MEAVRGLMYEVLELAYQKIAKRDRVRRENGLPALDTRAETFSAFNSVMVSRWERDCGRYEGVQDFIRRAVAAEVGESATHQRIHLVTRRLFYTEMEQRFGYQVPRNHHLLAIFNEWWEAKHAV